MSWLVEIIYGAQGGPPNKTLHVPPERLEETIKSLTPKNRIHVLPVLVPENAPVKISGRWSKETIINQGKTDVIIIDVDRHDIPPPPPLDFAQELAKRLQEKLPRWWNALRKVVATGGGFQLHLDLGGFRQAKKVAKALEGLRSEWEAVGKRDKTLQYVDVSTFEVTRHQRAVGSINEKQGEGGTVRWRVRVVDGVPLPSRPTPLDLDYYIALAIANDSPKVDYRVTKAWRNKTTQNTIRDVKELKSLARIEDIPELNQYIAKQKGEYSLLHCPIHPPDKNPSMICYHHSTGEVFYDAHDGSVYDIFDLYGLVTGKDFKHSVKDIADLYGITIRLKGKSNSPWDDLENTEAFLKLFEKVLKINPENAYLLFEDSGAVLQIDGSSFPIWFPGYVSLELKTLSSHGRFSRWCLDHGIVLPSELLTDDSFAKALQKAAFGAVEYYSSRDNVKITLAENLQDILTTINSAVVEELLDEAIPTIEDSSREILYRADIILDKVEPSEIMISYKFIRNQLNYASIVSKDSNISRALISGGWKKERRRIKGNSKRVWVISWNRFKTSAGWQWDTRLEGIKAEKAKKGKWLVVADLEKAIKEAQRKGIDKIRVNGKIITLEEAFNLLAKLEEQYQSEGQKVIKFPDGAPVDHEGDHHPDHPDGGDVTEGEDALENQGDDAMSDVSGNSTTVVTYRDTPPEVGWTQNDSNDLVQGDYEALVEELNNMPTVDLGDYYPQEEENNNDDDPFNF